MKRRMFQGLAAVILLMILLTGALPFRAAAASPLLGDLNGDGKINALDYAMLKRHVLRTVSLPQDKLVYADINGDGKVSALDYGMLKKHVLKTYDIFVDDHLFLKYKNGGNCEVLQGKVSILLVFVSDSESTWDSVSRENAEQQLREEMIRMTQMAKESSVDLTLYYGEWDISVSAEVESYNADQWEDAVSDAMGFDSLQDLQMALERDWEVASAPVVFVLNKAGRAAAYSNSGKQGAEYLTLYQSDLTPFCHELLHLYGARDLYFPMTVSDAATAYLTDSIMFTGEKMDPLTAYLVGWAESLTEEARAFLKVTAHLTAKDLEKAAEAEQFTGYGTKYYANGDRYVGYMEFGTPYGEGEYYFAEGTVYNGMFENGNFHGKGVMRWTSGNVYEGDFFEGARTGKGVFRWASGDVYEGDFVDGARTGYGVYRWTNGSVYEGGFIDGARTGYGVYRWASGDEYEGDFIDGIRTGYGVYRWPNGDRYEGGFLEGKLHGQGVYYFASGDVKTGTWIHGVYQG